MHPFLNLFGLPPLPYPLLLRHIQMTLSVSYSNVRCPTVATALPYAPRRLESKLMLEKFLKPGCPEPQFPLRFNHRVCAVVEAAHGICEWKTSPDTANRIQRKLRY